MPIGWNANAENQQEFQRQEQAENFEIGQAKITPKITEHYHLPPDPSRAITFPPNSIGSRGLDVVDLCLVPDDSLMGAALSWYVNLENEHLITWRDLAEVFIRQYKYNEDMALDRSRLQNLSKTESEGFKDYA
ncbi:hypothetical protein CR513_02581, partial [Mucuna pruriens]